MNPCSLTACVVLMSSLWGQNNSARFPESEPGIAVQSGQRPRIGLVLEGGGALGFAHVGVIK